MLSVKLVNCGAGSSVILFHTFGYLNNFHRSLDHILGIKMIFSFFSISWHIVFQWRIIIVWKKIILLVSQKLSMVYMKFVSVFLSVCISFPPSLFNGLWLVVFLITLMIIITVTLIPIKRWSECSGKVSWQVTVLVCTCKICFRVHWILPDMGDGKTCDTLITLCRPRYV